MSTSLRSVFLVALASLVAAEAPGRSHPAPTSPSHPTKQPAPTKQGDHQPGKDAADDQERAPSRDARRLNLPPRPAHALGGRRVLERLESANLDELEAAVVGELLSGNVPAFLRELEPVDLPTADGFRVWVTKDYLSVGSDVDFVRVPLRAAAAERVARAVDALLPTKVVVDAIARQAAVRLPPRAASLPPAVLWRAQAIAHDVDVDRLARRFGAEPGLLVAGHMKDVVITPSLELHPGKLAIYGLHDLAGDPIQPLSVLHGEDYVDYSHGIRLVLDAAVLADETVHLIDVLGDEDRCRALSPEGPVDVPAYDEAPDDDDDDD